MREKAGFVYIMVNSSLDNMIKIGLTTKTSDERAKELSKLTGIPTKFIAVYDELVSDCKAVEKILHERFSAFRVNDKREFFGIPCREAIIALQNISGHYQIPDSEISYSRSFRDEIRYGLRRILKNDIKTLRIVHADGACYLEITRRNSSYAKDDLIEKIDLHFIADSANYTDDGEDKHMFKLSVSPNINADIFVNKMDIVDILNCTPEIVDDEAIKKFNGKSWDEIIETTN